MTARVGAPAGPDHQRRIACAIHQPNFFPRLTTLLKIALADAWVLLSRVQFARRDYQHRCLIAPYRDARALRWCTVPVHAPQGRSTLVENLEVAHPEETARRVSRTMALHYSRSPGWPCIEPVIDTTAAAIRRGHFIDAVGQTGTALLHLGGWKGDAISDLGFDVSEERSERLADLAVAARASEYICGAGGRAYLRVEPFDRRSLGVSFFRSHALVERWGVSEPSRRSALDLVCRFGVSWLQDEIGAALDAREALLDRS
ncbi:MAG TPA: WbqC family protein [Acidimicrobiia bacterium]|nr:WbqC family protein [Acidimicrobiia bacterium]